MKTRRILGLACGVVLVGSWLTVQQVKISRLQHELAAALEARPRGASANKGAARQPSDQATVGANSSTRSGALPRWDELSSLPAADARTQAVNILLAALASGDVAGATALLDRLPPGLERADLVTEVAARWAETDAAGAVHWVDGILLGQPRDQALAGLLNNLAKTDPAASAEFLAQLADPAVNAKVIPALAGEWAQKDLSSALAWVQALPASEGDTRLAAFNNALNPWIQSDPAAAAAFVAGTLPDDPNFKRIVNNLAGRWASVDPSAALAWAEALPPGSARDNGMGSAVATLARTDPLSAWNYSQTMPPGSGTVQTQANILAAWSLQNPAEAAAHLADLPPNTIRDDQPTGTILDAATLRVANNWIQQDPLAASQWISSLPPGSARDGAVLALLNAEGKNDLSAAFSWAASLSANGARTGQINDVVTQWAKKDPAAAAAAVESTPMPDAQRSALLSYVQKEMKR